MRNRPNQPSLPIRPSRTPRACAQVAPASLLAGLGRHKKMNTRNGFIQIAIAACLSSCATPDQQTSRNPAVVSIQYVRKADQFDTLSEEQIARTMQESASTGSGSSNTKETSLAARLPRVLYAPSPKYPASARKARIQGTVVIESVVDGKGNVQDAHVASTTDHQFDENALAAVRAWRFTHAIYQGRIVKCKRSVPLIFLL